MCLKTSKCFEQEMEVSKGNARTAEVVLKLQPPRPISAARLKENNPPKK
jgi:hypothetical protein